MSRLSNVMTRLEEFMDAWEGCDSHPDCVACEEAMKVYEELKKELKP